MKRTSTIFAALCVALFVADDLEAQRRGRAAGRSNRNAWRRPAEITERTAAYFSEIDGPKTDGDKVAPLNSIELVRAAAASGQITLLYLHDGEAERRVVQQFESSLFRMDKAGDELGLKLRMFHCGQIDVSKSPALKARYEKEIPLFVGFDKTGKQVKEVSMRGYKANAGALEALVDKASSGAYKPSVKTIAKKHAKILEDLEEALKAKSEAEQDQTRATDNSKAKKAEKALAAATKLEDKALKAEEKLLEDLRLPARGDKKLGGRNNRRSNRAGNTGSGNTGKGNTGKGNTGRGNAGRGNTGGE